jgi:single-stranded-DNA-specific exonuclease
MNYRLRGKYPTDESCLAAILEDRGVENVEKYLSPMQENELNPYDLDNIREGAEMLLKHLRKGSKILFVVDSDCDGFSATSILWLYCKDFFPQADLHFTLHEGKKHGLEDKIDWIESQDFNLIVVPDAGSYDKEEMERIVAMGAEVLDLDHHQPQINEDGSIHMIAPNPHAIIINNQLSEKYTNKSLCGAGVVYKFIQVMDNLLDVMRAPYYLDLVAVGEISDVMFQGTNETRYYITKGLKNIHNEGIKALIEAQSFSLKDKAEPPYNKLTPIDVAFYISPLINAVTRMGSEKELECMFYAFTDPARLMPSTKRGARPGDTELAAQQFARVAGNIRQRQNKAIDRAMDLLDYRIHKEDLLSNNVIYIEVFPEDKIPQSITGLLCQRFVSKYNRPCLIGRRNSEDLLQGSMRGNANFSAIPNLKAFLEDSGYFEYVAG